MDVIAQLGELLRAAELDGGRSSELLAEGGGVAPPVNALLVADRGDDARLGLLMKLFIDGRTLSRTDAELALTPLPLDAVLGADLLAADGSDVRSRLHLRAFEGLIVAGDAKPKGDNPSYVMPLSLASKYTAHLTVRRQVDAALDLGTGSGVQALLAARHADRVVGVDINPRALSMARLNQRLNGVADRITWREGSWLEAVGDERFDLVVATPPYVISPDNAFLFRDTDAAGDELSREIVRGCAGALAEGGFATVMCNWIHRAGAWEEPLCAWVAGLGCDALLLHTASQEPLSYAIAWNRALAKNDAQAFGATIERWAAHYRSIGAERLATGFVILRRRSGAENWIQTFQDVSTPSGNGAAHVERIFAGADLLKSRPRAQQMGELLSRCWRLLDGHRLDQSAVFTDGAYVGEGRMSTLPDMGIHATIDARLLPILLACDGSRSLGELIEEAPIPEHLDRAGFHGLCLGAVRGLIARGYLLDAS